MVLTTIKSALRRLWTQLKTGSGTEGEDCGAISVLNIITWASRGKVGPDVQTPARDPQSVANWVKYIRRIANRPRGAMMVMGDMYEALVSSAIDNAFKAQNVRQMRVDYRYGMTFGDLRKWLAGSSNRAAILPYDYGIARRDGAPVGSTTFSDAHVSVLIGAQKRRVRIGSRYRYRWYTILGDSLMDGRRKPGSLKRYPKGWLLARLYKFRRAAGQFGTGPDGKPRPIGYGRCVAILVERA